MRSCLIEPLIRCRCHHQTLHVGELPRGIDATKAFLDGPHCVIWSHSQEPIVVFEADVLTSLSGFLYAHLDRLVDQLTGCRPVVVVAVGVAGKVPPQSAKGFLRAS